MRIIRQRWGLALLFAAALISTSGTLRAASAPAVRLDGEVKDGVVRLIAQPPAAPGESGTPVPIADTKPATASGAGIEHVQLQQDGGDTQVNVTGNAPLTYHAVSYTHLDVYKRQIR